MGELRCNIVHSFKLEKKGVLVYRSTLQNAILPPESFSLYKPIKKGVDAPREMC